MTDEITHGKTTSTGMIHQVKLTKDENGTVIDVTVLCGSSPAKLQRSKSTGPKMCAYCQTHTFRPLWADQF